MNNVVKRITILAGFAVVLLAGNPSAIGAAPEVNIAQGPLFSGSGNVHPNMLLDLSVEFPTVGAAYRGVSDYNKGSTYLGYFNPEKCYTYPVTTVAGTPAVPAQPATYTPVGNSGTFTRNSKRGGSGTPVYRIADLDLTTGVYGGTVYYQNGTGSSTTVDKADYYTSSTPAVLAVPAGAGYTVPDLTDANGYFRISKTADANHECGGDSFSGNFLNWVASSSIDMLRYAMTGGDRVIDEATRTVLQRAWLPDGKYNSNSNFYANGTYFPRRTVAASATMSAPNQVTPFTTSMLYVVSCLNRVLFSNTNAGGNCDTARTSGATPDTLNTSDKYFGEYLARVSVCDSGEGPTRTDLCQKYGSNYKPEGQLQRHSDKIRVGALGYLTGHDTGDSNLYGGVVRGPVKYVGPKKFEAPSFSESANDRPEWDATTGVFYNNPEDAANRTSSSNSGVINYLNKFGRTNTARPGAYKSWDPVGELYYEALRYLQGKQPTNDGSNGTSAISALGSETTDDNFPVVQTLVDPITASCQNNYILTIGDVNTHNDAYQPGAPAHGSDVARTADALIPGNTDALNVVAMTNKVGALEADSGGSFGNLLPRTNLANLSTIYTTTGTGTMYMAGMAYWANMNNIRADKPVRVKTFAIDVDEGGNGSIEDTNPRGTKPRNSQLYLAAKYGGFLDRNKDGNPYKTFAADGATVLTNNSEWAANGTDPDNYFLASDPAKMIGAIKNIFQVVSSNSGTISGVTLTSTKISADSSYVYQPGFDPSKWSGNLLKLKLQLVDGAVTIQDAKFPTWDAGLVLTGMVATTTPVAAAVPANPAPDNRKIYTSKVEIDGSLTTVPFSWSGGLTSDQKALIDNSPVTSAADGLGENRVNYLRGSRVDEIGQANGIFRQRDRVLGDIINSNPTYIGAPAANIQGDDYKKFYDDNRGRTKAVYVGANDGMLHAFNAADGVELFAYVPNAVIPDLNKLTDPDYVHRPYVDGTLAVREAKVDGNWKTILASGMGGGAQGVFVLDVTNPEDFVGGTGAIWEFTDKDDADMGNLASTPQVAKFRTGVDATTKAPVYKYFVVVPSGLNNYKDDGYSNFGKTDAAEGALFLLSLDKKPTDAWSLGTNYYKFKTPVKDATLQNGLSAPALVLGNDGAMRYAYAGDLQGDMWRFDFTGDAPWSGAKSSSTPLFTAKDKDGVRQPITGQPVVVTAPGGGYVVLFGTGKYLEDADAAPGNFKTQSFYGIYDTTYNADAVTGRSQLEARTLAKDATSGSDAVTITGNNFSYGVGSGFKKGWYFDFLNSGSVTGTGERSVTNPLIAYGRLFFNSLVTGSDPCATGGGRTYSLSTLTGLPLNSDGVSTSGAVTGATSTVGMLSSPVLFETGTTVGDRDSIGKRVVQKKFSVFNFGTGGKAGTAAAAANGTGTFQPPAGRMSWREILNWQELHNNAKK